MSHVVLVECLSTIRSSVSILFGGLHFLWCIGVVLNLFVGFESFSVDRFDEIWTKHLKFCSEVWQVAGREQCLPSCLGYMRGTIRS